MSDDEPYAVTQRKATVLFMRIAIFAAMIFSIIPAYAVVPVFGPITSLSTPTPARVAAADFNKDGHVDEAITDPYLGAVVMQLGNGDGTFKPPVAIMTSGTPGEILAADLNGDGNADLIVGDSQTAHITILLGNGNGTFHVSQTLNAGPVLRFRIVDFNADGIFDLAVLSANSDVVELFPGMSDGTFGTPVTVTAAFLPIDVAVGDVNGDGLPDLVLLDSAGSRIAVMAATAVGQYGPTTYISTANAPTAMALVPNAQTGFFDLAVSEVPAAVATAQGWVEIFEGAVNGAFASAYIYPLRAPPLDLVAIDLSGDGIPDLVLLNPGDDSVSVLTGTGGGIYANNMTYRVGYSPYGFAVADVNGDGMPDIVTTSSYSGTVSVQLNQGHGSFPVAQEYSAPITPLQGPAWVAQPTDVNGDGFPDVVVVTLAQQGNQVCTIATAYLNNGTGTLAKGPESQLSCAANFGPGSAGSIIFHDMNGDGKPDLVFLATQNNIQGVAVAYGNGDGSFQPAKVYAQASLNDNYFGYSVGDVNGDGKPDVVVCNLETNGLSVYLQQADGSFHRAFDEPGPASGFPKEGFYNVAVADLANNGSKDLIIGIVFGSKILVYPVLPGANGLGTPTSYPLDNGIGTEPVNVADVNKDGWPDVITASRNGIAVLLNNGNGTLKPAVDYPGNGYCSSMIVADMNGDGSLDVICTDSGNGINDIGPGHFTIYYGNGDGTFRVGPAYSGMEDAWNIYAADMNGDGKLDVVTGMFFYYPVQPLGQEYAEPAFDVYFQRPSGKALPPVSVTAHYYVPLDEPIEFSLQGMDESGAAVQHQIVIQPTNGSIAVSPTNPQDFIYTPNHHFYGYDKLGFLTTSASGTSNVATVTFEVYNTNQAPKAQNAAISIMENVTATGTLQASDPDGDSLTFSIVGNPQHGVAKITNTVTGAFVYTPSKDYAGSDIFTFSACDWNNACGSGVVAVTITAPGGGNGHPIAAAGNITVIEGSSFSGSLPGKDSDGDPLDYSILSPPANGTVTITDASKGTYTYTPSANYVGRDSFIYQVSDGAFSANASISVTVVQPNNPPVPERKGGGAFGTLGLLALLALWRLRAGRQRFC